MDTRSGALQHPCIFPVIWGFFSLGKRTKKHIGRLHRLMDVFLPMQAEMIGFTLTVIQNTLHCWESGTEKPIDFSADMYGNIFDGHLQWINMWKAKHPDQWRIVAEDLGKAAANTCGYTDTRTLVGKTRVMRDDD
ncbi:hypothetical protein BS47DRAFT_1490654 [Hydnum rufescens UP504]|uniref:DUF6532 domain-containing protein n=1 Tax=Hydnum rufescens UP504 TaxID=1448309 RepID=A0A9P6ABB2_9AGAM|nr:hypothetical protein BS47DRAFT_1490654 [Hydnum rufescens UP504]